MDLGDGLIDERVYFEVFEGSLIEFSINLNKLKLNIWIDTIKYIINNLAHFLSHRYYLMHHIAKKYLQKIQITTLCRKKTQNSCSKYPFISHSYQNNCKLKIQPAIRKCHQYPHRILKTTNYLIKLKLLCGFNFPECIYIKFFPHLE